MATRRSFKHEPASLVDQSRRRRGAWAFLKERGAEDVPHPGGPLLAHLGRTADLLDTWGAPTCVVLAGLCHAAYGTDGFNHPLLDLDARADLTSVIGAAAEEVVYFYASCDRRFTYPQLASGHGLFRDRFTREVSLPKPEELRWFMEMTFANELDMARHSPKFAEQVWPQLVPLFSRSQALVSGPAWDAYLKACPSGLTVTTAMDGHGR